MQMSFKTETERKGKEKLVSINKINVIIFTQEFERMKKEGLIKHLGVSNFNERQIQRLLDNSTQPPEVLQVNYLSNWFL